MTAVNPDDGLIGVAAARRVHRDVALEEPVALQLVALGAEAEHGPA
jgi:hypothetical protein